MLTDGFLVTGKHVLTTSKGTHQNEQGRLREVKVCDKGVDNPKVETRSDEKIDVPCERFDVTMMKAGDSLERPYRRCPNCDHATTFLFGTVDSLCRVRINRHELAVHLMLFERVALHRSERT